jgi:hypothetical protein
MSSNSSAAAFAGFDASAEESQPPATARMLDLAALAAALAGVEALLAAVGAEGPEDAAAIERIADIAFVLHERDIEPSLCDALDAAVREISAADARKRASVQRAREAAALLRELSQSLNDIMVASANVEQQPQPAATVAEANASSTSVQIAQDSEIAAAPAEDELSPPAELFAAGVPEDDAFALTVAELAEALPEAAGTAPADLQHEMAEPAASSETLAHSENPPDRETTELFQPEEAVVSQSSADENLHEPMSGGLSGAAVDNDLDAEPSEHAVLPEAFLTEPAAAPGTDIMASPDMASPESSVAALEEAEPAPAIESVEAAQPDTVPADALVESPAEESTSTMENEPVAVMPAAAVEETAPDDVVVDQSLDQQTTVACAVADREQEPSVPELTEDGPMDTIAQTAAAHDETPAQDEQSAERVAVAPEPTAAQPFIDPDEDPGDLFETLADPRPLSVASAAAAIAAAANDGGAASASISHAALPLSPAASTIVAAEPAASASALRLPPVAPVTHAAPRPPVNDPLAPIRALSAEELIALFS